MGITALLADARSNPFGFAQELNGTKNARISLLLSCHFNIPRSQQNGSKRDASAGADADASRQLGTLAVAEAVEGAAAAAAAAAAARQL